MKQHSPLRFLLMLPIVLVCCICTTGKALAQKNIIINMALIDGVNVTMDNILGYQIHSSGAGAVQVNGSIRYRNSNINLSYSFAYNLRDGINTLSVDQVHPRWQYSSAALQDLFVNYRMLPEGTYEYCVTITPVVSPAETPGLSYDECLYHKSGDLFLINLIDPADNAKIREYNPVLSWIANYTFSNELTYRLRIAEIKQGQNAVTAIMHNQPMYDEKNLLQNSIVYPVFAKPLEANKPYAWTVDAYFHGILLGGSETWKFTIIDDTVAAKPPVTRSYIDIRRENGTSVYYIMGELKIKYVLDKYKKEELTLELLNDKRESVGLKPGSLTATYGDNRYELNLKDNASLKHMRGYTLVVKTKSGETFLLPFKYLNPDFTN